MLKRINQIETNNYVFSYFYIICQLNFFYLTIVLKFEFIFIFLFIDL